MSQFEIRVTSGNRFGIRTEKVENFQPPYINPWIRLSLYAVLVIFSGCLYSGWNGIEGLLYKSGSFEDLCTGKSPNYGFKVGSQEYLDCAKRTAAIDNLFVLTFTAQLIGAVFAGIFIDYVGPKITYILGQLTAFGSWVMITSVPKSPKVLKVCFITLGFAAEWVFMPLTTVCNYFPKNQSLILAILGSARTLSGLPQICISKLFGLDYFKINDLYKLGIGYATLFMFSCLTLGSIIIQKRFKFKGYEKNEYEKEKDDLETTTIDELETVDEDRVRVAWMEPFEKILRIHKHPRFEEYLILSGITALFITASQFILRSHSELLVSKSGKSAASVFKFISVVSFVAGPLLGWLMDNYGSAIVLVLIHFSCVVYLIFSTSDYYAMKVIACLFFILPCSLSRSETYCYVKQRFPTPHYGVLSGLSFLPAGIFSLINVPLFTFGLNKLSILRPDYYVPLAVIQMIFMIVSVFSSVALFLITKPHLNLDQSINYLDSQNYF